MIAKVFDAAFPPDSVPPGCVGALGYIGGARATRVWTVAEWLRFRHIRQFPAWVPPAGSDPATEARSAVTTAERLGWAPHQPDTRAIIGDLETGINAAWWQQFATTVGMYGFVAVAYGSLATVLGNAASDVWAADWDGDAVPQPGQTIHGHQYQATESFGGTQVDYSVVDDWLLARGGVGPRHGSGA